MERHPRRCYRLSGGDLPSFNFRRMKTVLIRRAPTQASRLGSHTIDSVRRYFVVSKTLICLCIAGSSFCTSGYQKNFLGISASANVEFPFCSRVEDVPWQSVWRISQVIRCRLGHDFLQVYRLQFEYLLEFIPCRGSVKRRPPFVIWWFRTQLIRIWRALASIKDGSHKIKSVICWDCVVVKMSVNHVTY